MPMGGTTCWVTFDCWQGRHSRAHLVTSCFIDGQTTFSAIDFRVLSTPGCPRPWKQSKTFLLEANGMNGLAGPLEKSAMMEREPMSIDLKWSPVLASALRALNSGSIACWSTILFQSRPSCPIALTTQLRSLTAVAVRVADAAAAAVRFLTHSAKSFGSEFRSRGSEIDELFGGPLEEAGGESRGEVLE